jgi:hypothetical protein
MRKSLKRHTCTAILLTIVTECRQMQNSLSMHPGGLGDRIIPGSLVLSQPQREVGFTGGVLDPFKEAPYRFVGYLGFP